MKKQIITLIIGILIGAIITACIFLIARPKNSRGVPDFSKFDKNGEGMKFDRERPNRNKDDNKETPKDATEDTKQEDKKDEKQA